MMGHFGSTNRAEVDVENMRLPVQNSEELVMLRKHVRDLAVQLQLSLIDQTKLVTAVSELARNALKYGGGGEAVLRTVRNGLKQGVRLLVTDTGPGIADLDLAMLDGFTSGGGMGLGLGGARRLVDDFAIQTTLGIGTAVTITKWKK